MSTVSDNASGVKSSGKGKAKSPVESVSPGATKVATKGASKTVVTGSTPTSMDELLALDGVSLNVPKHGDVVEGIVTGVTKKMVLVDIAGKTEGLIVDKEYEAAQDFIATLHTGDKVSVYVVSAENDRGQILLSFKRAMMNQKWDQFEQAMKTEEVVIVRGMEMNKGGMIAGVDGVRGFIPTSQFGKQ